MLDFALQNSPVARALTRTQALQNRAFLKILKRTGNVRLSAREVGVKYGTIQHRRKQHPDFALKCDAALVFAQASLAKKCPKEGLGHGSESPDHVGRARLTSGSPPRRPAGAVSRDKDARFASLTLSSAATFRTAGGEPVLRRIRNGRLQLQRAQAGKLTPAAEQAFLAALSATCNVTLAAAAVGACFNAFNRRRKTNPAFAREMRMALEEGYDRLEEALLEAGLPGAHEHDDWRHNDPPATPPMTVNQALQLMYLHQKEARLLAEPDHIRRRPGESREAHSFRLSAMYEARLQRDRERFDVAEALRRERGEPSPFGPKELPLPLPDLAQVTGWSRADPTKAPHRPQRALFGGWRLEDMEKKRRGRREWEGFDPEEPKRARPRVRRL